MQKPVSDQNGHTYEFGSFRLEVSERRLFRDGVPVALTPKVFDTLLILVANGGRLTEKQELMSRLWPDSFVEEGALTRNISDLRKALGEKATGQKLIETVPKRGYRFVAEVHQVTDSLDVDLTPQQVAALSPTQPQPETILDTAQASLMRTDERVPLAAADVGTATPRISRYKRKIIVFGMALCLLLLVGWWSQWGKLFWAASTAGRSPMKLSRLTTSSDVFEAAISPDEEWLVYVRGEGGKQSLWSKGLSTGRETQLFPTATIRYRGLTFSRDGHFIYFARRGLNESDYTLFQMPVQGGAPQKILTGIHSAVTFSPDGKQMAYVLEQGALGKSALMVANADGHGARELAVRHSPEFYSVDGPSWSPDGKLIATALGSSAGVLHYRMWLTRVADGSEQPLGNQVWDWAKRVAWLRDGRGILLVGRDKSSLANQVWQLDYPGGGVQRIVNDLNDYRGLSLSADAQCFITVQTEVRASIWVVPTEQPERASQITFNPASQTGFNGLDWTPDGRIVYTARSANQQGLWLMRADGGGMMRLTQDPDTYAESPSVAADGSFVAFTSGYSSAPRIWRVNLDGSQLQALTKGILDLQPDCSPDSRWVVYSSNRGGKRTIWKVSATGGATSEPVKLTESLTEAPVISPDGQYLVCDYQEKAGAPHHIALFPITGGPPQQLLNLPVFPNPVVRWHPQGQALSFLQPEDDSSNVWLQPLSGGPRKSMTRFQGEHIFAYAWSADAKYLACSRGMINRDVVMIENFR